MMSRSLDDPTSWWFYAAIHGEYVSPDNSPEPPGFPGWGFITPRPQVPATPLPAQAVQDSFWNQCQHGSWYFFPWHRGYLMALEAQLRQDIIDLGGPADWALPYWNYFGGEDASQYPMPPAFAETALPDGSDNPLFVAMRYGANNDRKIYIPTPAGSAAMGDPGFTVTEDALSNDLYSGTNPQTPAPGFGGPETGFEHRGGDHGNLEKDPHDLVHVAIGGGFSRTNFGLMSNPGTAALDPVFYLHHANIDRLWAVWNAGGNSNPTSADWLNGPVDRPFVMPDPAGQPWSYTPMQVQNLASLNYTYEELQASPLAGPAGPLLANRFSVLGAAAAAEKVRDGTAKLTLPGKAELLGASNLSLPIRGKSTETTVKLDSVVRHKAMASLTAASASALPDDFYLRLENITGNFDASVLRVFVSRRDAAAPDGARQYLAGCVALFGLDKASLKDGLHGGSGLTLMLDITPIIDDLHITNELDADSLSVKIVPSPGIPDDAEVTVGRISIFRQAYRA